MNAALQNFLQLNLPKVGKKTSMTLGVGDTKIGNAIQDTMKVPCKSDELVLELLRYVNRGRQAPSTVTNSRDNRDTKHKSIQPVNRERFIQWCLTV